MGYVAVILSILTVKLLDKFDYKNAVQLGSINQAKRDKALTHISCNLTWYNSYKGHIIKCVNWMKIRDKLNKNVHNVY